MWGISRKTDADGRTKVRRVRPEAEWVRLEMPELRIVDDATWQAVAARRQQQKAIGPRVAGYTLGSKPPALLAGVGRCAVCEAGMIRRDHITGTGPQGRRREPAYACGTRHRNGACANRVEILETTVDAAVLTALAETLSPAAIEAAVQLAVAQERDARAGSIDRRQALARELAALTARMGRLAEAIAAGGTALAPVLEKLGAEQVKRQQLERELADLDALDTATEFATAAARRALTRHANQIRTALFAHPAEAREVLQAFVPVLRFTPFGARRSRGFDFEGEGDYGPLLGRAGNIHDQWCPRRDWVSVDDGISRRSRARGVKAVCLARGSPEEAGGWPAEGGRPRGRIGPPVGLPGCQAAAPWTA